MSGSASDGVVFLVMVFIQTGVPRGVLGSAEQEGSALVTQDRAVSFPNAVLSGAVQGSRVIKTLMNWGARGWNRVANSSRAHVQAETKVPSEGADETPRRPA